MGSAKVWDDNLGALRRCHPEAYRAVTVAGAAVSCGGAMFAPEPESHLRAVAAGFHGLLVFVGIGSGLEPLEVLRHRPGTRMLVVVEPFVEVFAAALASVDLVPLLDDRRVHLFVGGFDEARFEETVGRVASQEDIHVRRHVPSFEARPGYAEIDRRVFLVLNNCNTAGGTTRRNGEAFFRNRFANLSLVRHSRDVGALKGLFAGRPAVLVAAGPSLDREKGLLAGLAGRAVIIAADSAVVPLAGAGVVPDFVTTIDYQAPNFEKLAPLVGRQWPFSLIASLKVTPLIPARLRCRRLFWAFEEDLPQQWVHDALGVREFLPPGSSVAHLALVSAILMGCDPLVLVGQDLAYTGVDSDHAEGTVISAAGPPADREMFMVPGVGGTTVATDRLFMQIQKEFEEAVASSGRTVINTSAAGARIAGTVEMPLAEAADRYLTGSFSVDDVLASLDDSAAGAERLLERGRRVAGRCAGMRRLAAECLRVSGRIQEHVGKMCARGETADGIDGLPGRVRGLFPGFDRLNRELDAMVEPAEQIMELTFAALRENDRRQEENSRIREEHGYIRWLLAELGRVDEVNRARMTACDLFGREWERLSRFLEEEGRLSGEEAAGAGGSVALARCYAERGLYALAAGIVDEWDGGDVRSWIVTGDVRAGLLDFGAAADAWARAADREAAGRTRQAHAAFWLDVAVRHVRFDGEIGDFPALLPVWLGRMTALAGDRPPGDLAGLWQRSFLYCRSLMAGGDFAAAAGIVAAWQGLERHVPAVGVLRAEMELRQGRQAAPPPEAGDGAAVAAARAMYFIAAGNPARGLDLLCRAVAVDPGWGALWEEVGDVLASAGDHEGACLAYERCFTAVPDSVASLRKIGDCQLALGRPEAARAAYEAVLSRAPGDAAARAALAALP